MFPKHKAKQRDLRWFLLAIILLGFFLRLYRINYQSLWWDEVKTIERSAAPFPELIGDLLAKRHHVPLYFVLMKGWLQMGQLAFIARSFSMFWGVISLALIYQLGRRAFDTRVGLMAALFLAINPFHIWYSQEARMYTLLVTGTIAAHLLLLCLLKKDTWFYWVGYLLVTLTAVYTHLFSLLILVVHYIFFALHYRHLKKLFLKWIGYTAITGALFAVWAVILMQTGGLKEATPPWIVGTAWYDPFLTLLSFSTGRTIDPAQPIFYLVPLIYLAAILTVILNRTRMPPKSEQLGTHSYQTFATRLLLIWLAAPLLLTFFVSLDWPGRVQQVSIYTDRYLIIILPAMLILATWGLHQFGEKKSYLIPLALVLVSLGTVPGLYNNYFRPQYGREDWRTAANQLITEALPTDLIWSRNDHQVPLTYYLDKKRLRANWIIAAPPNGIEEDFEEEMRSRIAVMQSQADRVWLVTQFYTNDIHGFPQQRNEAVQYTETADPQYEWLKTHLETVHDETLIGIRLTLFDLSLITPPSDS